MGDWKDGRMGDWEDMGGGEKDHNLDGTIWCREQVGVKIFKKKLVRSRLKWAGHVDRINGR